MALFRKQDCKVSFMVGGKTGGEFSGKVSRKRYDHDEGKKMSDECEPDEENERRKRTHLKRNANT